MEEVWGSGQLGWYQAESKKSDRFFETDHSPLLMGLYSEVGSIMGAVKKLRREDKVFTDYKRSVIEEFGDAIWYFNALCRRRNYQFEELVQESTDKNQKHSEGVSVRQQAGRSGIRKSNCV
jgi:hypothetical protein